MVSGTDLSSLSKHTIGLGSHKEQRVAKECNSIHPKLPLQTVSRRDPFFSYFYSKSGWLQEIPPLEVSMNLFLSGFPSKLFFYYHKHPIM